MRFSSIFSGVVALSTLLVTTSARTFQNPLKAKDGSDPFIVYSGGQYFMLTTTWSDVEITAATTIDGLRTAVPKKVWADVEPTRAFNLWAPEIHWLNNRWYLYYTAGTTECCDNQRLHVLEGGSSPLDPYTYKGQLSNNWSIDGTILRFPGQNYLVYSGLTAEKIQSLFIAKLINPWTIGPASLLSKPTASWETVMAPVNEGPAALYHGGKTYLTFSASFCWSDKYQLGLLTYKGYGDPMIGSNWSKEGPVFSESGTNYGTGHNCFFTSPDGKEIWNCYHATPVKTGNCAGDRYTMVQKLNWHPDGRPNFGWPLPLSSQITGPSGEPA